MTKEVKSGNVSIQKGVVFAIIEGKKMLLEKRLEPDDEYFGYTIVPGGGVEEGESWENALLREIHEECGVEVVEYEVITSFEHLVSQKNKMVGQLYLVRGYKGNVVNQEVGKAKHVWATLGEAREVCEHPLSQLILNEIEKYLSIKEE